MALPTLAPGDPSQSRRTKASREEMLRAAPAGAMTILSNAVTASRLALEMRAMASLAPRTNTAMVSTTSKLAAGTGNLGKLEISILTSPEIGREVHSMETINTAAVLKPERITSTRLARRHGEEIRDVAAIPTMEGSNKEAKDEAMITTTEGTTKEINDVGTTVTMEVMTKETSNRTAEGLRAGVEGKSVTMALPVAAHSFKKVTRSRDLMKAARIAQAMGKGNLSAPLADGMMEATAALHSGHGSPTAHHEIDHIHTTTTATALRTLGDYLSICSYHSYHSHRSGSVSTVRLSCNAFIIPIFGKSKY